MVPHAVLMETQHTDKVDAAYMVSVTKSIFTSY